MTFRQFNLPLALKKKKKTYLIWFSYWQVPDLFPIEEACGGSPKFSIRSTLLEVLWFDEGTQIVKTTIVA